MILTFTESTCILTWLPSILKLRFKREAEFRWWGKTLIIYLQKTETETLLKSLYYNVIYMEGACTL
jgi:hypothetical protein